MAFTDKPAFASFWFGADLPAYERAAVRSFTARGYEFTLYSYEPLTNLPEGVKQGDARLIADPRYIHAFVVNGKPSLSHFTDYFRCSLFHKTKEIWVDVDIILLRKKFEVNNWSMIAGYETPESICGAVLRLDSSDPRLAETLAKIEAMAGKQIVWGATGPKLLTKVYGAEMSNKALPPSVFYPINFNEYYKFLLPEFLQECRVKCKSALTLHLWNNSLDKAGIWKDIGPPEGSFLHEIYTEFGAINYFKEIYPEKVMRIMLQNEWFYGGPNAGFMMSTRLVKRNVIRAVARRLGRTNFGSWER